MHVAINKLKQSTTSSIIGCKLTSYPMGQPDNWTDMAKKSTAKF